MSSHEVVHGDVARKLHSHSRAKIQTYCSIVFTEGKKIERTGPQMLMAIAIFVSVTALFTQDRQKPAYLNLDLPAPQRAEDLVGRMTVEEKVTQLVNQSRAIPKLSLPASHLAYWDTKTDRWVVEKDRIEIAAGGSSSDVRLRKTIPVR